MNGVAACNCSDAVQGVGGWGDILGGIGAFFSKGVGLELVKSGISFGVGYGIHKLTTSDNRPTQQPQPNPGNLLGGGTGVNPAGSIYVPQVAAGGQVASASAMPDWLFPVSLLGAAAVLVLALRK